MDFYRDRLELRRRPLRPGRRAGPIAPSEIGEVRPDRWPPELVLRTGEVVFLPSEEQLALDLFARVHGIPAATRLDVWALINEPFLDTELSPERQAETLRALAGCGLDEARVRAIRDRVRGPLLSYNALLWDWTHLGHQDALVALSAELGRREFEAFYWESMEIAALGPATPPVPIALEKRLEWRWDDVLTDLGIGWERGRDVFPIVYAAYAAPDRHYHGVAHLGAILDGVRAPAARSRRRAAVVLAAWFHDLVYVAGSPRNEEESAARLGELLLPRGAGPAVVREAQGLVRATARPLEARAAAQRILVDADLSILAEEPKIYDVYAAGIRAEFAGVAPDAFRRGRAAFLSRILAVQEKRGRLFHGLQPLHETLARENLLRELEELA